MDIRTDPARARLRLLQLVSPSLPVGAFAYSQGLEWAVEAGWVRRADDLGRWLDSTLRHTVSRVDLPCLRRVYRAVEADDHQAVEHWTDEWLAWRETAELRAEERNKGRALSSLLRSLDLPGHARWAQCIERSFLTGFAAATATWRIPLEPAAQAYVWGWLENQVISAVKLVPLGQTDGQRLLHAMIDDVPAAVTRGLALGDSEIGAASTALAIASSRHETQYTRLYRS